MSLLGPFPRRFLLQRYETQPTTVSSNDGVANVVVSNGNQTATKLKTKAFIALSKTVAHGIEFAAEGPAALFWPDSLSISTYPTLDALKKVHCSSNSVHDQRVEWIDG